MGFKKAFKKVTKAVSKAVPKPVKTVLDPLALTSGNLSKIKTRVKKAAAIAPAVAAGFATGGPVGAVAGGLAQGYRVSKAGYDPHLTLKELGASGLRGGVLGGLAGYAAGPQYGGLAGGLRAAPAAQLGAGQMADAGVGDYTATGGTGGGGIGGILGKAGTTAKGAVAGLGKTMAAHPFLTAAGALGAAQMAGGLARNPKIPEIEGPNMTNDQASIDKLMKDTQARYTEQQQQLKNLLEQQRNAYQQDLTSGPGGEALRREYNRLGLLNSGAFNQELADRLAQQQQQEDLLLAQQGLGTTDILQNIAESGLQRQFGLEDLQYQSDLQRALANARLQQERKTGLGSLFGGLAGLGIGSQYGLQGAGIGYGIGSGLGGGLGSLFG